jgi:hypothetical protein
MQETDYQRYIIYEETMDFKEILSQSMIDEVLTSIDWEHAYFREIYVLSPSYMLKDSSQVNPDALVNIGLLILTFDPDHPALEFRLKEVSMINISFNTDIRPKSLVLRDCIELHFDETAMVRAKSIDFRIIDKEEAYGDRVRYGKYWEELFE